MSNPLYHCTPRRNLPMIATEGLTLAACKCRKVRVWLCEGHRLPWAIEHLSARHGIPAEFFSILEVQRKGLVLTKFRDGIFTVGADVPPSNVTVLVHYAKGEPE